MSRLLIDLPDDSLRIDLQKGVDFSAEIYSMCLSARSILSRQPFRFWTESHSVSAVPVTLIPFSYPSDPSDFLYTVSIFFIIRSAH